MRVSAASYLELGLIEARTGCVLTQSARGIKAEDAIGRIRGMVAFDGWTPNSVSAHMMADTPIVWRTLLPAALSYAFDEARRGIILATIVGDNRRSLEMVRHVGFREVYRLRDGWSPGVDLHHFELRRHECCWLNHRKAA